MATNLRRRGLALLMLGLAVVLTAGGCGGPPRAKVRGTVTLDGKPIKDGAIEFFPADGNGQTAGASIKDGVYEAETSVGKMRVTINASEVVGKQKAYDTPDSPMMDIVRNSVPARYNTKSELTADLVAGSNEVNFDLKSDHKK